MPIIRARYPDDWEAIASRVKQEANWCCERCGRPCQAPGEPLPDLLKRVQIWRLAQKTPPADFAEAPRRYLLTVAHLDQRPENCDRSNLQALCTVCHLRHDGQFRGKQRRLKREWFGQLRIDEAEEAGLQLSLIPDRVDPYDVPRWGTPVVLSPPEQLSRQQRRHSPKGEACGWIEERLGNKGRKNPSISYYYCWDEVIATGETQRQKLYIKVNQLTTVRRMVDERQSVEEIVEVLRG